MMVKDRQTPNLRWPKIDVLKIIPGDDELRGCWRADRHLLVRRRALDEIHRSPVVPRRSQHPHKALRFTLPDRALDADLGAADPADAAKAAAPGTGPNSAEADSDPAPMILRHSSKWLARLPETPSEERMLQSSGRRLRTHGHQESTKRQRTKK